jgi:hypothetical protein
MGGKTYRRGIVAVPRTVLTYVLDGSFDVFEADIGMAEEAGPQAHAVFRVLGDGATLFESADVTPATEPHAIRVPVRGVAELALEVDFGEAFDLGDLCLFASPRIRKL